MTIGHDRVEALTTMVDQVAAKASTQDAYMIYGVSAFFLVAGFSTWGTVEWATA